MCLLRRPLFNLRTFHPFLTPVSLQRVRARGDRSSHLLLGSNAFDAGARFRFGFRHARPSEPVGEIRSLWSVKVLLLISFLFVFHFMPFHLSHVFPSHLHQVLTRLHQLLADQSPLPLTTASSPSAPRFFVVFKFMLYRIARPPPRLLLSKQSYRNLLVHFGPDVAPIFVIAS